MSQRSPIAPGLAPEVASTLQRHAITAAAVGLLPAPLLDLVLVTGVQLNMLRSLSKHYEVEFSEELGRAVLASLVGSSVPWTWASVAKLVPGVGWALGGLGMPVFAGASTWAVGRVFVQHFESGGTFLTLDPEAVRGYYQDSLKEGEAVLEEAPRRP